MVWCYCKTKRNLANLALSLSLCASPFLPLFACTLAARRTNRGSWCCRGQTLMSLEPVRHATCQQEVREISFWAKGMPSNCAAKKKGVRNGCVSVLLAVSASAERKASMPRTESQSHFCRSFERVLCLEDSDAAFEAAVPRGGLVPAGLAGKDQGMVH